MKELRKIGLNHNQISTMYKKLGPMYLPTPKSKLKPIKKKDVKLIKLNNQIFIGVTDKKVCLIKTSGDKKFAYFFNTDGKYSHCVSSRTYNAAISKVEGVTTWYTTSDTITKVLSKYTTNNSTNLVIPNYLYKITSNIINEFILINKIMMKRRIDDNNFKDLRPLLSNISTGSGEIITLETILKSLSNYYSVSELIFVYVYEKIRKEGSVSWGNKSKIFEKIANTITSKELRIAMQYIIKNLNKQLSDKMNPYLVEYKFEKVLLDQL